MNRILKFEPVGAHWTVIGVIPAVIVFFYVFRDVFNNKNIDSVLWWILHIGLVLSLVLTISIHLLLVFNYLLPEEVNIAGLKQEFDHKIFGPFYGWEEVGKHINTLHRDYGQQLFYITPHYALSSMLSFNTPGQPLVRVFGQEYIAGLNYMYWSNYNKLKGNDAIFIYENPGENYINKLKKSFHNVNALEPLEVYDPAGHHVRTFYFFYCEGFDGRDMTTSLDSLNYIRKGTKQRIITENEVNI